ncbi:stage V sporulation protein AE [Pseudalkalibacillus caeni]|uniref:Stage V sporulation protein AE n=1 Tax=Exobacillus caeni TaxID=2574798 RepID=A0A5R9EWN4_9BACL|nr:stage V sporulation protein AE [Pseudalkalibacillus caeni]TLS35652.1 stage V sporulation protein AE [Pseudalkalibacillus caeni]
MQGKKRVILVTDGDLYALKAIETVAKAIGGRCISQSFGNPSERSGNELVKLIHQAPYDPVFVMFDDCGYKGEGKGESAMKTVASHPDIEVVGAIAVASNAHSLEWSKVNISIDRYGNLTEYGVDKSGVPDVELGRINGDTVSVLDELDLPYVIGIGDIGKMAGLDDAKRGSPVTKKAVEILLERSEYYAGKKQGTNSQKNKGK